jgi:DNA-binding PadR family transcriptional regulator
MKILSRSDEILLLAILSLRDNAYGVTILKEVYKKTGKKMKIGGLWVSLDILCKRGLLTKWLGDPTPARGGKSKIYYKLTEEGLKVLKEVKKLQESLWQDYSEASKNYLN